MTEILLIFSRYPEAGKTKTRMIPALGSVGAAKLQQQMTEHTLATAKQVQKSRHLALEIHFTGGDRQLMSEWLGTELDYYLQVAGDLGQKMHSAFARAFKLGGDRVVAIGIDCPALDLFILNQAFDALTTKDLVLGGAEDGGYYLIGLKRSLPMLFDNISWGTNKVLEQTKAIANNLNLDICYLPRLNDVDRPNDLWIWQQHDDDLSDKLI